MSIIKNFREYLRKRYPQFKITVSRYNGLQLEYKGLIQSAFRLQHEGKKYWFAFLINDETLDRFTKESSLDPFLDEQVRIGRESLKQKYNITLDK